MKIMLFNNRIILARQPGCKPELKLKLSDKYSVRQISVYIFGLHFEILRLRR